MHNGVVYWANYVAGGTVMSVPTTGGTPTVVASNQVLASHTNAPTAVAVDATGVYYTAADGGRVWRVTPP